MISSAPVPELASELRLSVGRLRRRLAAERASHPAPSITAVAVLCALDREGPLSVGHLAGREGVRPPSMTRAVRALESQGWVRRTPHPDDGRVILVEITPRGRRELRSDRAERDRWLARQLEELSVEDRAVLERAAPILEKLSRTS